jgi:hypothetical protein
VEGAAKHRSSGRLIFEFLSAMDLVPDTQVPLCLPYLRSFSMEIQRENTSSTVTETLISSMFEQDVWK